MRTMTIDETAADLERVTRPDELTGSLYSVEFVSEDVDRKPGTYITIRADDPEIRWSAGRVAVRYLVK